MDDCWLQWPGDKNSFLKFKDNLNSIWPNEMMFTHELEKDGKINFLDVTISLCPINDTYEVEFYQKPTHSGKYLDFKSHCPISTKINIIKSEARRIVQNCTKMEKAWPHLEKLKQNLIASNYPPKLVISNILNTVHNNGISKNSTKPSYDYVYSIPFVNEALTIKIKNEISKLGINARVVPLPGKSLQKLIKGNKVNSCSCILCEIGIKCNEQNIVYQAKCLTCKESYIGATGRFAKDRIGEHEQSIRCRNNRSTLGQHIQTHGPETRARGIQKRSRKPDLKKMLKLYEFSKIAKGKDVLEVFIKESFAIASKRPGLNNMLGNGFVK